MGNGKPSQKPPKCVPTAEFHARLPARSSTTVLSDLVPTATTVRVSVWSRYGCSEMVSSGAFRALGVSLAALLLVLVGAASVSAASSCSVTVTPKSGAAGTTFTFHGQGFKPTNLMLHKNDKDAGQHSLNEPKD